MVRYVVLWETVQLWYARRTRVMTKSLPCRRSGAAGALPPRRGLWNALKSDAMVLSAGGARGYLPPQVSSQPAAGRAAGVRGTGPALPLAG